LLEINSHSPDQLHFGLMTAPFRDPAEKDGFLRHFYRAWRPTRLARIHNGIWAWASALGLLRDDVLTLQTRNRTSGALVSTVLAPVNHNGKCYLVSMLGHGSQWVQNARSAGGEAFIKRGRKRRVMLVEIPIAERAPILKAWSQVATSGRKHLPVPHDAPTSAFEAIADHYPVFRIDPANQHS
jgi:hypothetical protein